MGKLKKKITQHFASGAGKTGASSAFFRGSAHLTGRNLGQAAKPAATTTTTDPRRPRSRTAGLARTVLG